MDLKTRDVPGAAAFFETALGWRFTGREIVAGEHRIGGVSDLADPFYPPGIPAHIACYLAVDDVAGVAEAAVAHGARLVVGPFEVEGQGAVATLLDPVGVAFSLWEARGFAGWDFPPGTPNAPIGAVHVSDDSDRARRFYRDALGLDATVEHGDAARWEIVVHAAGRTRLTGPDGLDFRLDPLPG
ncbi:VOC family protein [Actinosynnema sp. NPDC047251]|nr:VOC family protein [Saccharothrix espanaensis]